MESNLQQPALVAAETTPKVRTIAYWIVTVLFCLQMPRRSSPTSRWAMARRCGAGRRSPACSWGLSYFLWRRLQATPESA